jgi:aryl-phospho-beta-D-glucosidase BglC (GH1 family)
MALLEVKMVTLNICLPSRYLTPRYLGQSHSGISDGIANLFNNEEDQQKTIAVLVYLAQQLSQVTNVVGIQLLNEPNNAPNLPDFCK